MIDVIYIYYIWKKCFIEGFEYKNGFENGEENDLNCVFFI